MRKVILALSLVVSVALSGCQTLDNMNIDKESIGGVFGAITGGIIGSNVGKGKGQLVAVGIGTLVGGLVGSEVGKSLDKADMAYANRANEQAHVAPIGEKITWDNPQTGNYGTVTPLRDGYDRNSGSFCREYEQEIFVDGQKATGTGIACQQPDGRWEIMN